MSQKPAIDAVVPCGTCTACCRNFPAIFLHEDYGDKTSDYKTVEMDHPLTGKSAAMLQHKENGDCIHLVEGKCEVYENRPAICREYDCRKNYLMWTRRRRDRLGQPEIWDAAKKRLHTLSGDQRLVAIAKRRANP